MGPEYIALILAAIAAGTTAYAAYESGQSQKRASNYNRMMAENNAIAARQQAAAKQKQQDRETKMRLGAIRANQGAFGGAMEGSALDVLGDTAAQLELQRQNIEYAGELQARGFDATAVLDSIRGENAARAGYYQAGASLLGGASSVYGGYSKLNRGGGEGSLPPPNQG